LKISEKFVCIKKQILLINFSSGFQFQSSRVIVTFAAFFLMMAIVPVGGYFLLKALLLEKNYSENKATMYSGLLSALSVNIIMGIYFFIVVFDAENYKFE